MRVSPEPAFKRPSSSGDRRDSGPVELLKRIWQRCEESDLATLAAAVSYYAIIASIPFIAVLLTLSTQLLPRIEPLVGSPSSDTADLTARELKSWLTMVMPNEAEQILSQEIARIQNDPPVALLSIGIGLALWTASNAFMAVIKAMNKIYSVEETRPLWRVRMRALFLPLVLSAVLMLALICILVLPALISFLKLSAFAVTLLTIGQWFVVFSAILLSFGFTYKIAPNHFKYPSLISIGSIVGAAVFLVGCVLFQMYVANFGSYQKVYGSFGGVVIFLIWNWLASASLLFGCVVNAIMNQQRTEQPD